MFCILLYFSGSQEKNVFTSQGSQGCIFMKPETIHKLDKGNYFIKVQPGYVLVNVIKVTRPSYFVSVPAYFEALWYPYLYFDCKSNIYM